MNFAIPYCKILSKYCFDSRLLMFIFRLNDGMNATAAVFKLQVSNKIFHKNNDKLRAHLNIHLGSFSKIFQKIHLELWFEICCFIFWHFWLRDFIRKCFFVCVLFIFGTQVVRCGMTKKNKKSDKTKTGRRERRKNRWERRE